MDKKELGKKIIEEIELRAVALETYCINGKQYPLVNKQVIKDIINEVCEVEED